MDYSTLTHSVQSTLGVHLPGILAALGILIVGWLLAVVARAATRKFLSMTKLNRTVSQSTQQQMDLEGGIAAAVFWIILLITVIGVFNTLNLDLVSNPFSVLANQIFEYLPRLIAGGLLLVIAWFVATAVKLIANKALAATSLDDKLSTEAGMRPMSEHAGNVLFWLVLLMFIPAILGAFQLDGLLVPVQGMVAETLEMLPNIFAALAIGFVGWLVAKVLRGLTTNLLAAAGADRLGERVGLRESFQVSRLAGTLVFIFVFVPALIAALDALQIRSISQPATEMLGMMLAAVPNILAAAVILVVTYYVARFAAALISRLLANLGFNTLPQKLGWGRAFPDTSRASDFVGKVIIFFAMLFATVEAANRLGFTQVRDLLSMFIAFGADILLGAAILAIGFWLANVAFEGIRRAGGEGSLGIARIARFAILGLVIAMGLRAMGIADDIVNIAFGLTLGAVAVAAALSFGLGGREAAGKQMEYWFSKLRREDRTGGGGAPLAGKPAQKEDDAL